MRSPYHPDSNYLKWILSILLAVVVIPGMISAQDITSGLVLHYSCENISGGTLPDISGSGNDGTLFGNASAVEGYEGQGVQCIAKQDYIVAPDHLNAGLSSFTFSAWVKLNALKNATRFFDWGSGVDGSNNFIAFIPSYDGDNGYMNMRFRPSAGTAYNVVSNTKCSVGKWAHVAVTYSWNGSTGSATLYLNGEVTGSRTGIPYDTETFLGTGTDNYFGRSRWGQDLNGFNGTFDDVRVYNRALSAEEVGAISNLDGIYEEFALLNPVNLSMLTEDIVLPQQGTIYPGVQISWTSSQTLLVEVDGTVHRPDYFDYPVELTATLQLENFRLKKVFQAKVLAKEDTKFTGDLLLHYDFSNQDGEVIQDVAEKQFSGTLVNSAKTVTIGNAGTGIYNVLHTGDGNGYFDMGLEAGIVVSSLRNFTISAYYRIDPANEIAASPGYSLWTFSNSENAVTGKDGYLTAGLGKLGIQITPGYNTSASGLETVAFGHPSFSGHWHHFAYTQRGNLGIIYIDGAMMAYGEVTQSPLSSLFRDGSLGTDFNWLGRSPVQGESYLENTLIWDLRVYNRSLTAVEISERELNVMQILPKLEKATEAFLGDSRTAETAPPEIKQHPAPTYMEITNKQNFASRIQLANAYKMTFDAGQTLIETNSGGAKSYVTDDILHIMFGPRATGIKDKISGMGMEVYPNPSKGRLFVSTDDNAKESIRIISLTGTVLRTIEKSGQIAEVDINDLPPGLYIVKRGIHSVKFLKQ